MSGSREAVENNIFLNHTAGQKPGRTIQMLGIAQRQLTRYLLALLGFFDGDRMFYLHHLGENSMSTTLSTDLAPITSTIHPALICLEEKLPGGAYWHGVIKRGKTLRIQDLAGSQGVSIVCYNADNPIERFNVADTAKIQFNEIGRAHV